MSRVQFTKDYLRHTLRGFAGKRIAILGDLMLDRYYWGGVRRVSPEAPVPVVEVETESVRFGGAANVAQNIRSLGGIPVLVGLIGNDHPGELFMQMVEEQGFERGGIIVDAGRQTTIKTRVIAQGQHVVRIDNETKSPCPPSLVRRIIDSVTSRLDSLEAVLLEDYNKGVLLPEVIRAVVAAAREYGKIITVDPKFDNFLEYRNVTVFKPNRREVEEVLGGRLRTNEDVERAGRKLLDLLEAESVLLTRGEQGMSLLEANGGVLHLGTGADNVQDVSGAGDTVISTLTLALAAGFPLREACTLANCAGGVVVGSVGIVPIELDPLIEAAVRFTATTHTDA